ncbi:MFS transporter [Rhodococcus opacus]|uniref:MFS transporter n=1 Tax=Rhodococcus opacus TaxID=37919 RepID=A0AAX3YLU1_RHOOP|nr:MFS transporter [Rhodococcus opacus]ELB90469.1 major facilitator superfamily multidrug resistance protein [Rhodococcus wratislaviensis IFP 2016]NHU47092.1 MFS transporter [Rhodococcus sp. A14]MBA8962891.1 MFS family permease [Rhodococcus opacus]MBP2206381.1 MFS family permease [Rhodococcus opacus]MCZ4588595.1 MFS transporter [Rhodococcus opacus]
MKSWFVSLCLVTALLQAVYAAVRVMISYRALELGGNGATVGILTALYSLVPLVAAIPIGRAVDGRHAAAVLRIGAALSGVAVVVIITSTDLVVLAAGSILLGFGHILTLVSGQGYVPLMSSPDQYDRRFGGLTVWISVGQSIGIPVAGIIASRSHEGHVETSGALLAMLVLAALAATASLSPHLRTPKTATPRKSAAPVRQSTMAMLSTSGMRPAVFSSLIVLTSMDLTTAYLPVLGEQYGFSVLTVTAILTARSIAAIVSRVFLTRLLQLAPRRWLLISGTLCSALPVALIPAVPQPIIVGILMAVAGFFWGLAQPLTMTWVAGLVPPSNRASALSLRLTGNRLGQVFIPLTAGAIAGSTGTDAVFVLTGGLLAGAAFSTWRALTRE